MKNTLLSIALASSALAATAQAETYSTTAKVIDSTAIVQRVNTPRQECTTETAPAQEKSGHGVAGAIIGGVAGGLLGHQIGGGSGNTAATVAGAVGGAMLGNHVGGQTGQEAQPQTVQRCQNVGQWTDQVTGYKVTYQYDGHTFVTTLPQKPGSRVPVSVNIQAEPQ